MSNRNEFLGEVLEKAYQNGVLDDISKDLSTDCRVAAISLFLEKDNDNCGILKSLVVDPNMRILRKSLLFSVIRKRRIDLLEMLIEKGINVNPLYLVVGNVKHADHGANVPIFNAVEISDIDIVRLLLSAGADVNILCDHTSILSHALVIPESPSYEIIKELLFAGAKISTADFGMACRVDMDIGEGVPRYTSLFLDYGFNLDEALSVYREGCSNYMIQDLQDRNPNFTFDDFVCF